MDLLIKSFFSVKNPNFSKAVAQRNSTQRGKTGKKGAWTTGVLSRGMLAETRKYSAQES